MKTNIARGLLSVVLGLPGALAAAPAAKSPAQPAEPKPYVLFMGADLAVLRDKGAYRVEDVAGSELKIHIGKKEFFVRTRSGGTSLKVDHALKLSGTSVKLDNLESGPAYTPANDPNLKFIRASGAAGGAAAVEDLAYGQMISQSITAGFAEAAVARGGPGVAQAQAANDAAQQGLTLANRAAEQASAEMQFSQRYNTGALADQRARELAEENYDAMEVSFKISSPVELENPYMIVLFKFQERDAKPGQEGLMIHAKSLDPIGPKPKYIRVREGGLPRGFKYLSCEVRIYDRGEELATNVSPKRVELTRSEAQQYIVIEHLGAHKGATVPAAPVSRTLPAARRQQLSIDQLNHLCYVKVAADGTVLGAYDDEAGRVPLNDPAALAALGDVFFRPALEKGKPVEGTVRVRLGEI